MSDVMTIGLLQDKHPNRAAVEQLFAEKSNEVLLGALANPDHSDEARQILTELVAARGLHGEEDDGWMMAEASMFVKPFGPKPTFDEALAAPGKRRRLYRTLQLLVVIPIVILLATLVLGDLAPELSLGVDSQGVLGFAMIVGVLAWFFGGMYSWTRPVRMLLLRPFQSRKVSGGLKRFVRKNMAFHGHTFLLSDR